MEKGDFIGRAALETRYVRWIVADSGRPGMIERGIARDGYCCCNEKGETIGVVTSGSPSPS